MKKFISLLIINKVFDRLPEISILKSLFPSFAFVVGYSFGFYNNCCCLLLFRVSGMRLTDLIIIIVANSRSQIPKIFFER